MTDIDLDELSARLGDVRILDVRRIEEYRGTSGAMCDPRQGHIPGALSFPIDDLLLSSEDEVREQLGVPAGGEVVAYCHSGSRSATAVQILQGLGYDARNYWGSWHEWSRTNLPLENSESPDSE
jgi:thiosulfate/3-mercaptopyruvate sulfurtransferase